MLQFAVNHHQCLKLDRLIHRGFPVKILSVASYIVTKLTFKIEFCVFKLDVTGTGQIIFVCEPGMVYSLI